MFNNRPAVLNSHEVAIVIDALNDATAFRSLRASEEMLQPESDNAKAYEYQRLARKLTKPDIRRNWAGPDDIWKPNAVFIEREQGDWVFLGEADEIDFSDIPAPFRIVMGREIPRQAGSPEDE